MRGKTMAAMLIMALNALPVLAEDWEDSARASPVGRFFIGVNYGYYKTRGSDFDDDNDLLEAVLGINLSRHFGLEVTAIDLGRIGGRLVDASADGWTGSALVRFPLTRTLGIHARAGMLMWDARLRGPGSLEQKIDDSDFFYGGGLEFYVSRSILLNAEYIRYRLKHERDPVRVRTDLDAAKVGVRLQF